MSNPVKTTWKDLESLGWPKQKVFDVLNPLRDNTMSTLDDMVLNEGFAAGHKWTCYNVIKGKVVPEAITNDKKTALKLVWEQDNSKGTEQVDYQFQKEFTTSLLATLTVSEQPRITLDADLPVTDVSGSGIDLTIKIRPGEIIDDKERKTENHKHDFAIIAVPGERVFLVRMDTVTSASQIYHQHYGFDGENRNDMIGTTGNEFQSIKEWGYAISKYLDPVPSGKITFEGKMEKTEVGFFIVRVQADGTITWEDALKISTQAAVIQNGQRVAKFVSLGGAKAKGNAGKN